MTNPQPASPELLDAVRSFRVEHIDPHVATWEREQTFPVEALRAAGDAGLLGMEVPAALGGLELTFGGKIRVLDVLCETSMPFAFSLVNTANIAARIATDVTDEQRDTFLPGLLSGELLGSTALTEPGAGSDFGAITTTAERTDGGWLLNGEKGWITNAAASTVIVCYAQTEPGSGGSGIASFLIDGRREGFERVDPYALYGGHAIGTGGFRLHNYFAADEELLAPAGEGFKVALGGINGARTYVAALCCAMVRSSLRVAVDYGAERHTFGEPVIRHQGLAWSLATVANQLEATELLTQRAIDVIDGGGSAEAVMEAAHAKKFATEMAEPAIAACIQAMGAHGLREQHPLGRHMAGARIANYVDGSTEIQTDRIARSLAKNYGSRGGK